MKKNFKLKIRSCIAAACVIFAVFSLCVSLSALDEPEITGVGAAYLYNIENQKVIYSKDADVKIYPASSVKIMTALVAYEALSERLDESVTITSDMLIGVVGNSISLAPGEQVKISDLFYATLLRGANDAAQVLAILTSGSVADFVSIMNLRATELGAFSTVYTNPTGMHSPNMVTTAADTAKIAEAFAGHENLIKYSGEAKYILPATNLSVARTLYNRNALISKQNEVKYYYSYAQGINAGSTSEGGQALVTFVEKEDLSYLCVILGGEEKDNTIYSYTAAKALCEYALNGFGYIEITPGNSFVAEIPVKLSTDADYVSLVPSGSVRLYMSRDIDPETDFIYKQVLAVTSLNAPVKEGEPVGYITVLMDDTIIGTIDLVTKNNVERSDFLYTIEMIGEFTSGRFFKATVIALVAITVIYVLANSIFRQRKANRQRRRRR